MTEQELKSERIPLMLSPTELKRLDDWAFARRIRSRGEAIRQLIAAGLASEEAKGDRGTTS